MLPEYPSCLCGAAFLDATLSHAVHLHTGVTCEVTQPPALLGVIQHEQGKVCVCRPSAQQAADVSVL